MAKSAKAQLNADKQPKVVVLEKDFAGTKKGQTLYVATPKIIDQAIKQIPYGSTSTVVEFRDQLAEMAQCDASCPVSTAIFIRISAQAAIDEIQEGKLVDLVTPFWRLLSSEDKISQKLTIDPLWLDNQRALEQA